MVPAAGLGSRLGADVPKLLVPVAGLPMIDRLRALYEDYVSQIVLVVHPSAEAAASEHVRHWPAPVSVRRPAAPDRHAGRDPAWRDRSVRASDPSGVWITWCDQVAVHPRPCEPWPRRTATNPRCRAGDADGCAERAPYIHLERDADGRIVRVLHRREGDAMPDAGESDMGLFALSPHARPARCCPRTRATVEIGAATGERNFLPFIPLDRRARRGA